MAGSRIALAQHCAAVALTAALRRCAPIHHVPATTVNFDRQIRPLLSDRCFRCHGPDSAKRKAKLRLDTRDGAMKTLKDGWAIVKPFDPDKSELIRRIFNASDDERMPPPESHLSLLPAERALLRRWVTEGADYRPHWSFIPVGSVPVPTPVAWNGLDESDRCIRSRATRRGRDCSRAAGLSRSAAEASGAEPDRIAADDRGTGRVSRRSIARRVRQAVDRYLASPAYGERMAVDWLDLARYADTYGYQNDFDRDVSPYRDWVISAFNHNLPYDQFLTWQLAGDLLPRRDARAADCDGLQSDAPPDQRRRQRRRGVPHRIRRRSREHVRHGDARPHDRVRALPRSQVRSDHAARLLLALRLLQQHRRIRALLALHERHAHADADALDARAGSAASATAGADRGV